MEFKGQYLTYEEYKALGGTLDLTPFNLLEFESRRKIDIRTQNRLVDCKEIPQAVKLCIYKMINSLNDFNATTSDIANNGNIASENTDGYSVSYITTAQISDVVKSKSEELQDIMDSYLIGVIVDSQHIMFLGAE
jgi:hypothetical protein